MTRSLSAVLVSETEVHPQSMRTSPHDQSMNTDTDKHRCNEEPLPHPGDFYKPQDSSPVRHFDSSASAFRAGREDAVQKAREKGPQLKDAVTSTVHDLVYGLAFGACFAGAFANEFVPKLVKETVGCGFKKGFSAGKSAGEQFKTSTGDVFGDIADPKQAKEEGGSNELLTPA